MRGRWWLNSMGRRLNARTMALLSLIGAGCADPCNDLNCDRCATEDLMEICLLRVAVDDGDECQKFIDDAPSCE